MINQPVFNSNPQYDPRWFIWTIVFLIVTGISLVSYIVFSDNSANDVGEFTVYAQTTSHKPAPVTVKK